MPKRVVAVLEATLSSLRDGSGGSKRHEYRMISVQINNFLGIEGVNHFIMQATPVWLLC